MFPMATSDEVTRERIIEEIKRLEISLGRPPSRREFSAQTGIREYWIRKHFNGWNDAVTAAGFSPYTRNARMEPEDLLVDWAEVVRNLRRIPTRAQYNKNSPFSCSTLEKKFGPWSGVPYAFRVFARDNPDWADVLALLPTEKPVFETSGRDVANSEPAQPSARHPSLTNRATYGNPIDFRGLRHEPVNEQGVVFLFGMVARELGYMVEAVQGGFPDCEAKRQIAPGKWQRVHIEFEYESRNFRDHGHPPTGCDVIVCWVHNWPECGLEIVELRSVIRSLASSDE